jgi:hypothetical protein
MAELDSNPKSIQSLYGWYADRKLWVNRRYQRKLVWTLEEKQKLIQSVLRGYPIPAILLAERDAGDYEVIDGLQRLYTFMSFVETAFPTDDQRLFDVVQFVTANTRATDGVFSISEEYTDKLTPKEVGAFLDYSMAVSIMRGATDDEIDEVFSRINTYGHRLSDQERRQAGVQNGFSAMVRELASSIRGDVSHDVLELADMPEISIDLPMTKHGYRVEASEVFWVNQGILRSTELRDSLDEQCIADIAASIVGGSIIPRSKEALDDVYANDSNESRRLDAALASYGADKFEAELKYIIDEIRAMCGAAPPIKLRSLLFGQSTNSFPALFAVLAIALHELIVDQDLMISDYAAARAALRGVAGNRIQTSRGSTSVAERQQNINTMKGILSPHTVVAEGRSLYDNQSATDIDDAIRRSNIEAPHYELKQGLLRLDDSKSLDPNMLDKLIATACAIANNGPGRSGTILIGVADDEQDARRIETLYGVAARSVGPKYVVGIKREADALDEPMEKYFGRIKNAFANSALSEPLRGAVLASMSHNDYFSLGIIAINVPPQTEAASVGDQVFVREGDSTVEVTGAAMMQVARRF